MDDRRTTVPTVLVIDAAEESRALLGRVLGRENVAMIEAGDGREGLARASAAQPDLILLELQLPGWDGFETLMRLREDLTTRSIPVLLVSSVDDPELIARGLDLGAVDFIAKSSWPEEMRARVRAALRAKAGHDLLEQRAQLDALTGLGNRHALDERLQVGWEQTVRRRASLAVLVADLDRFKAVNDRLGHPGGDRLLRATAKALRDSVRGGDFVARYGGDEFVVVATDCRLDGALAVAERFRRAMAAIRPPGAPAQATVSVGVAASEPGDEDPGAILRRADAALYRAKAAGRDSVWASDLDRMFPADPGSGSEAVIPLKRPG
jgi:diguanylate cyclase (GGDEF)-like protein